MWHFQTPERRFEIKARKGKRKTQTLRHEFKACTKASAAARSSALAASSLRSEQHLHGRAEIVALLRERFLRVTVREAHFLQRLRQIAANSQAQASAT